MELKFNIANKILMTNLNELYIEINNLKIKNYKIKEK
jgi:hypothetical protein